MADRKTISTAVVAYKRGMANARKARMNRNQQHIAGLRALLNDDDVEIEDDELDQIYKNAKPHQGNKHIGGLVAVVEQVGGGEQPELPGSAAVPPHKRRTGGQVAVEMLQPGDRILYQGHERIVTTINRDRHMLNIVLDQAQRPPNIMAQVGDHVDLAPPPPPPEPLPKDKPVVGEIPPGEYWWCSCGNSENQPFCDGSHEKADTDRVPLRFVVEEEKKVALCVCKQTGTPPFCDGSHKSLNADHPDPDEEIADEVEAEIEDSPDGAFE